MNLALCCVIPVGTVLVAQPSFIFGSSGFVMSHQYLNGVGIMAVVAVLNSLTNVLQAKYKVCKTLRLCTL